MKVQVRANRQVVHNGQHHYGGDVVDVDGPTALKWTLWGFTDPLGGDVPTREGPSAAQGRANVRKRITEELAIDDTRSDRAIAEVVGCDHKTVAKARKSPPA